MLCTPRTLIARYAMAALTLLVTAGCESPRIAGARVDVDESAVGSARAAAILTQAARYPRGIEDEILRLETALPGFGGFYVDENGDVVVLSVGTTADVVVQARMAEYLRANDSRFAKSDGSLPLVSVKRAQYAFSELLDLLFKARAQLNPDDDVVFLDADEQRNRLRIGIGPKGSAARAYDLARRAGFDTAALYLESVPEYPRERLGSLRDKWRATFAGIQTDGPGGQCTMGFHVTDVSGTSFFLTASHCTDSYTGVTGGVFYQATSSDQVGVVSVNPARNTASCMPSVTYCSLADVALVQFDSPSLASKLVGQSTSVGTGSSTGNLLVGSLYTVGTQGDAASGTTVTRTGRQTGSTSGAVTGTCMDVGPIATIYSFTTEVFCGNEVTARADGSDSGGPVYHFRFPLATSSRQADGVVFASGIIGGSYRYYYNSWTQVESHIGRSLFAF